MLFCFAFWPRPQHVKSQAREFEFLYFYNGSSHLEVSGNDEYLVMSGSLGGYHTLVSGPQDGPSNLCFLLFMPCSVPTHIGLELV